MHRHRRPLPTLVTLATILLLCCAGAVRSQTSYDATLVSEYAARGAALGATPALQLRVEHDVDSARFAGWYAGAFASPVAIDGRGQGQVIAYAGRAQRLSSTVSWDVGVTRTVFTRDGTFNYHEVYASLALQRASVRLFYSPAYYGEGRSAYLDLNGAWPINERLRLALHAGLLHPIDDEGGTEANGGDVRIALGTDMGDVSLEAGWQVKAHAYLPGGAPARALTMSASLRF